jgi:hypothetical protein
VLAVLAQVGPLRALVRTKAVRWMARIGLAIAMGVAAIALAGTSAAVLT